MEHNHYKYKAFISYTAHDTQFVNQLEKWLIDLAAQMDAEKNYLFFRDRSYSDAGENVADGLKQRLEQAEWLILVCSPFVNDYETGVQNWVDFECSYYADILGRKDHMISIISSTAPPTRGIASFYPKSVRDLHEKLAADMRGNKEWGEEASRIYAGITGRSFHEVYNIAETFYWERQYYDVILAANKKSLEGNWSEALRLLSEIPDKYNPGKIEWNYLKAVCSKSAYSNYCGRLYPPAGNQVIYYDKTASYAYSADSKHIYAIDCIHAKTMMSIEAHNGSDFRFFYIGADCFGTFDGQVTLKLWKCEKEKIICIHQMIIEIPFTDAEPAVFKSFYLDCKLEHFLMTYHPQARLLALVVRANLFIINIGIIPINTYQTIELPVERHKYSPLAADWKRLIFSNDAKMVFLADDWHITGWNLDADQCAFFWPRKKCQPKNYMFYHEKTIFSVENSSYLVSISGRNHQAAWKDGENTIMSFVLPPGKQLDSVFIPSAGTDYLVLLYRGNTVDIIQKGAGFVYSETMPIEKYTIVQNLSQTYCPVTLWHNELWHTAFRQIWQPAKNIGNNFSFEQAVCYQGLAAAATLDRAGIAVFHEDGSLWKEQAICTKPPVELLTNEQLNLPPDAVMSPLVRSEISKSKSPEHYACSTFTFFDKKSLFIGCTKGRFYLWEPDENSLTQLDKIHETDITCIRINKHWQTILTADKNGMVAIWHYEKKQERLFLTHRSSFLTHKTQVIPQLADENEIAVFCNQTGELLLYSNYEKKPLHIQVLLSADAAKANQICQVLSMYLTADRSRLVVCKQKSILFIRIPDGKVILELHMRDELKEMVIPDTEESLCISSKDHHEDIYYIARLTNEQYHLLLQKRRETFFC